MIGINVNMSEFQENKKSFLYYINNLYVTSRNMSTYLQNLSAIQSRRPKIDIERTKKSSYNSNAQKEQRFLWTLPALRVLRLLQ